MFYIIRESGFPNLYHTERLTVKMIAISTKSIPGKTDARASKNGVKFGPGGQRIEIAIELTRGRTNKQCVTWHPEGRCTQNDISQY